MVTVRYYAGARAAAGAAQEQADAGDLGTLLGVLEDRHGEQLGRVLAASSLLIDGIATKDHSVALADGVTVEVLPPFAGG